MNIRIKVPSMAQFVPSSIFTMNGVVWPIPYTYGNLYMAHYPDLNGWWMCHVTFEVYYPRTDNLCEYYHGHSFCESCNYHRYDNNVTTKHTFKPVAMSLRDYYIKHVDEYLHKYTFGYDENLILIQWMEHPASGFQQFIKRSDWVYNPFIYDLDHLITGFVRSNRYKITRQIDEDIKITVSPCQ